MNRMIKIGAAAATLAGIALVGAGAAGASATHSDRSAAHTATQAAAPQGVWYTAFEKTLGGHKGTQIPPLTCPGDHHILDVTHNYSPGRIVPNGVQVLESGGVGVFIWETTKDGRGFPNGVGSGDATNWGLSDVKLTIRLRCYGDPSPSFQSGN